MTNPTCFISYSWDSDNHKKWIRDLSTLLQDNGVTVLLDQWDAYPGMDLPHYMETAISQSDYVLLICTPTFATKANAGKGGVGYEKTIVTGEVFMGSASPKKFVPILHSGDPKISLPAYLKSKLFIDFRELSSFDDSFEELLRHIYDSPKYVRPVLGSKPSFIKPSRPSREVGVKSVIPSVSNTYCWRCGAVPGKSTTCVDEYSKHDFTTSTENVYCSRCGAAPGKSTTCVGGYSTHDFTTSTGNVYCSRCGAAPGKSTTCVGGYSTHDFISQ